MRTLLVFLMFWVLAFGQNRASRITMQDAYRNWRLVDPNLEADAGNGPLGANATNATGMSPRAERVAAEAAKYFAERKIYYEALAGEMRAASKSMEPSVALTQAIPQATPAGVNIQAQVGAIGANLNAILKNPDAGLLELRHALERERAALTTLKELPAIPATTAPSALSAHAREDYADLLTEVAQESAESDKLAEAWASYYRALAAGASAPNVSGARSPAIRPRPIEPRVETGGESAPATAPASQTATQPVTQPATPTRERLAAVIAATEKGSAGKGSAGKGTVFNASATPTVPSPAPPAATVTNTVIDHADALSPAGPMRSTAAVNAPVTRYAGAWVYPTVGEHYHGAHPESVDLEIHADNGHVNGKFRTKFRIPPGVTLDPVMEFTFEGDYQSTRAQSFPYVTSDGVKGTLELIPATTFNLLEISFVADVPAEPKPGKITRGNFFLIRK